jgi:putative mycofactocin binding protein MftB
MVSAVSTEAAKRTRTERGEDLSYAISPSVRVRKEAFGLLFYDMEESRLTFVKSRDFLRIDTLPGRRKMISASVRPETRAGARKLLDRLLKKRLIRDA